MIVKKQLSGSSVKFAGVRSEIHGYGTTIAYEEYGALQSLELEYLHGEGYRCYFGGTSYYWHPTGPGKEFLEQTNQMNEKLAVFV